MDLNNHKEGGSRVYKEKKKAFGCLIIIVTFICSLFVPTISLPAATSAYTMSLHDTINAKAVFGTSSRTTYTSSDEDVAKIVNNQIKRNQCKK